MSIQYLSNKNGQITAVQVPIKDWEKIKSIYPDLEKIDFSIPNWQKAILDNRLQLLSQDPSKLNHIDQLISELDK